MITEREKAEIVMRARAGLTATDAGPDTEDWPAVADRIARARERAGLTHAKMAESLEVTWESYWDLERFDDEAFTVVSLETLTKLARLLGVEPRSLLLGPDAGEAPRLAFSDIAQRLVEHLEQQRVSVDQFGDTVGWDLKPILADPERLWDLNVEGLFAIADALGFDWVAALPQTGRDEVSSA